MPLGVSIRNKLWFRPDKDQRRVINEIVSKDGE